MPFKKSLVCSKPGEWPRLVKQMSDKLVPHLAGGISSINVIWWL